MHRLLLLGTALLESTLSVAVSLTAPAFLLGSEMATKEFLRDVRKKLNSDHGRKANLVLGNTSGDLDSICSAIAYAQLLHQIEVMKKKEGTLHVPILNFPRKELCLRLQSQFWLSQKDLIGGEEGTEGTVETLLTFIDDPEVQKYLDDPAVSISLTDHNELDASQESLAPRVTRVIDHHVEGPRSVLRRDGEEKPMFSVMGGTSVGSCCTLVTEEWIRFLSESSEGEGLPRAVAFLLGGPVLTDTINFAENLRGQRWSERDEKAIDQISKVLGWESSERLRQFDLLSNVKFDRAANLAVGPLNLLRMDAKTFDYRPTGGKPEDTAVRTAYASLCLDLGETIRHFGASAFSSALADFAKEKGGAALVVVLGCVPDEESGGMRRQLVLWSGGFFGLDQLRGIASVLDSKGAELENLELDGVAGEGTEATAPLLLFRQKNSKASRKMLEPWVSAAVSA
mmetsp:Transcript_42845/g.84502  ORF Transcript_42845/g.84502 Transcript_42845/m.84502 type:complete len:455 (+) Transcript_42845:167-1531(+)